MTIENETEVHQPLQLKKQESERDTLINSLTQNNEICFKSQQKWENDLTQEEKFEIGLNLFENNKLQFLIKFGKYLNNLQLHYFKTITEQDSDFEEINILINDLTKTAYQGAQNVVVKNRRYQAMVQMIHENSYFSEVEMMKRNPLLYNQLVGQYLSREEIKERDNMKNQTSFVKILMEGIERDNAEEIRQQEEERESCQMEEDDSSDEELHPICKPSTSHWGEIKGSKKPSNSLNTAQTSAYITPEERQLLKDEFVTTMYESFLDGKDTDFDYKDIDNDTSYDDIEELNNDEEEKYFASEEADEGRNNDIFEDELDVYMNNLR